jgi:aspartate/methionine/tyrosine aminotransferase
MGRDIEKITPFMVMDILKRARKIPDAVHMEVGEPDLPPPERVREAYIKAIRDGRFHYTPATGLPALREAISEYYQKRYSVTVSPGRVIITPGTSGAFLVAFALTTGNERPLVISDPSYPCYRNFAYFLGTKPLQIPTGKETDYEIKPEHIENLRDIGALMVSSPANPTGTLYSTGTMSELIRLSEERNFHFISDEIYHGLVYDREADSALRFSDNVIVINSFSKFFCMPGFRVGWMILPEELTRRAEIIIQNIFIAANTPAQYAALEAFDEEHLEAVRAEYRRRRDFLYGKLKDIFTIDRVPEGAFYIWADISRYSDDSQRFAEDLLEAEGVAVTPGMDFGKNGTERYIRLAYTRKIDELREGVKRIRRFLET